MIKLVYCIHRHPDIRRDAFHKYWLEEHGPKVKSVAASIGATRYVQSHKCLDELNETFQKGRGLADPYDGITEVWFESVEHMQAASATDAGVAAGRFLVEDESRFIDFSRSTVFMSEEHEIF